MGLAIKTIERAGSTRFPDVTGGDASYRVTPPTAGPLPKN